MKIINSRPLTLKKVVLAVVLATGTFTSAYAVMTGSTGNINGFIPVLSSPSKSSLHSVDFSVNTAELMTGSQVTLTYRYLDTDGDADNSHTTIKWYYVPNYGTGTAVEISSATSSGSTNTDGTTNGSSQVTIPDVAIGAVLKVVLTEQSLTGEPRTGNVITYDNIALKGSIAGPDGPGDTDGENAPEGSDPDKPGLIIPGSGINPGIYLSTDTAFDNNLIGSADKLLVGQSYVFKLFAADGVTDLTSTVNYNWRITGTSATTGIVAPAIVGFDSTVSNGNYTIPANANGKLITGSDDGVQGFNLAVDYTAK